MVTQEAAEGMGCAAQAMSEKALALHGSQAVQDIPVAHTTDEPSEVDLGPLVVGVSSEWVTHQLDEFLAFFFQFKCWQLDHVVTGDLPPVSRERWVWPPLNG